MVATTVELYMKALPIERREALEKVRSAIRAAAPRAAEAMSYGAPAFKLDGKSVIYAAFKSHIGLYPSPKTIIVFKRELAGYETSKGAIRFPLDEPMPIGLIKRIAKHNLG